MKIFKYIALISAVAAIILGIVCRIFTTNNILFGLGGITYLRLTVVMLLFALTFHFLLPER